jgi:CDP-diacylglycerol--serine O-phosphatidyltransferase
MGCLSIVFTFQGRLIPAAVCIFIAGVLDFSDGLAARLLKAGSEYGKIMDSLADVVSFGVAPSVMMFQLLNHAILRGYGDVSTDLTGFLNFETASPLEILVSFSAFMIAVFSALRLAKFHTDKRQTNYFVGMPTPANAFLIASMPFVLRDYEAISNILLKIYILIPLIVILSFLLVSEIPMISLKFKNLTFRDNKSRYILLLVAILLLIFFRISAYPLIFGLYLITSLIDNPQRNQVV